MQTERVTFLASATDKDKVFSRARRLGISSSEVIRRALNRDDEMGEEADLAALVSEANAAIPKINASIDRISARLEAMVHKNEAFLKQMGIER